MPLATMQKRALFLGVGVLMKTMPDDAQNTSQKKAYNNLNNSALKRRSEPLWEKHFWVDKSWTVFLLTILSGVEIEIDAERVTKTALL